MVGPEVYEDRLMNPIGELGMVPSEPHWRPRHLPVSAWHEHGLFARWLVGAVRPRSVVELGTHNGYSYFVFCGAIAELGIDAGAHAIDTWQGDDQAGFYDDAVFAEVERINEREFGGFSTLHRGYFDDYVGEFAPGSVDLLHIDGRHGYEDVKHDFESWLPTLSDRGVVLFHDIAEHQPGFGVWRLWEELAELYPSFAFEHGHGLGVLGVGSALPAGITGLFDLDEQDVATVRALHEEWGSALTAEYELAEARAALVRQAERIEVLEGDVAALTDEVRSLHARIAEIQQTLSWRITKPLRVVRAHGRR